MINDPPFSFLRSLDKTKLAIFNLSFVFVCLCLLVFCHNNRKCSLLNRVANSQKFSFVEIRKKRVFIGFFAGGLQALNYTDDYWCLFICSARWSDLEKLRSHWMHLKGLRPVCLRWCRVNSSDLANRHSHPSHEQR